MRKRWLLLLGCLLSLPKIGCAEEGPFEVAGLHAAEVKPFFQSVHAAVVRNDAAALSRLVDYPITVLLNGRPRSIGDRHLFLKYYPCIMTRDFRRAISRTPFRNLWANSYGVAWPRGELWLNGLQDEGGRELGIRITTINNEATQCSRYDPADFPQPRPREVPSYVFGTWRITAVVNLAAVIRQLRAELPGVMTELVEITPEAFRDPHQWGNRCEKPAYEVQEEKSDFRHGAASEYGIDGGRGLFLTVFCGVQQLLTLELLDGQRLGVLNDGLYFLLDKLPAKYRELEKTVPEGEACDAVARCGKGLVCHAAAAPSGGVAQTCRSLDSH